MGQKILQYGSDAKVCYFVPETTLGVAVKPSATQGFRITEHQFGQARNRLWVPDRKGTRSRMARTEGRIPVQPWRLKGVLTPSGVAGTAPDVGDLLKHALGTETVTGGTSVGYTPLKDPTALSASLYVPLSTIHEGVYGSIVKRLQLSWDGNGHIMWEAAGESVGFIDTGVNQANGTGSSATALIVDDADFFSKYSILKIGSADNSGAGYQVTAIDYATETLTIAPAATWSDNAAVIPFLPTATFAGSVLFGTDGSLSLDNGSTTIRHIGGSLTMETGLELLNLEAFTTEAVDVVCNKLRQVDLKLDFLVREDETHLMNHWRRKIQKDMKVTMGSAAGARLRINCNTLELDPSPRNVPETDMVRYSASGVALGSSGEDEVELLFD